MATWKAKFEADCKDELREYALQIKKDMAQDVKSYLLDAAASAIEAFYNSYTPISYHRHYWNFRQNSYTGYYKNPHNSVIYGGIRLTPEEIRDIYRADTNTVFNGFMAGMHGNIMMVGSPEITNIPPMMVVSPLERMLDARDYYVDHIKKMAKPIIKTAKGAGSYTYLH